MTSSANKSDVAKQSAGEMDELWGDQSSTATCDNPRLQRFVDEKYAMFIHWGLYFDARRSMEREDSLWDWGMDHASCHGWYSRG